MAKTVNDLVAWRRVEIVERVGEWQRRGLKVVDVPVLITCLDGMPTADLLALMGPDESRCSVAAYLLSNDPSYRRREVAISEMWEEQPFPRYVIALLFLTMLDEPGSLWLGVREDLWSNLTTTGQLYGPELLRELLKDLFSREELLVRSVDLVASGVDDRAFLGTNLFYSMRFSKAEIRSAIDNLLDSEQDKERIDRLRAVRKKHG